MQPTVESLQGELLALRGFVASLLEVMPLATRVQFAARLDRNLLLLKPCQGSELRAGFERGVSALFAKQRIRPGTDQAVVRGEERRSQPRS
ncbi:MAG TPA: hypothetical protein VFE95_05820 [Pseudomonas sp.]|nr:hypothetical protein [Pseudomonas sp.]